MSSHLSSSNAFHNTFSLLHKSDSNTEHLNTKCEIAYIAQNSMTRLPTGAVKDVVMPGKSINILPRKKGNIFFLMLK